VIFHGIDYLNSEIEDGSYFFVDVLKEGIMLYDSGNFQLSTPKPLNPKDRKKKAQRYFDKWFENAKSFITTFKAAFNDGSTTDGYCNAAFQLHQATERFYACILLVYTDYKPKIHDLEKLNKQVCKLDCRFKIIFPRSTDEEERLFQLLKKAYIDSRYKLEYKITKEELEYLSQRVEKLRDLTELACKDKIERFEG
jgi:HEPN domain-containing protein